MAYTFEKHLDESIVLFKAADDYSVKNEIGEVVEDATAILDTLDEPVFLILDFGNARLDMRDLMMGSSAAARGATTPFHHKMVQQVIFVTKSYALKLTAQGLNSLTFGQLDIPVFQTYHAAKEYIRSQTA